MGTRTLAQIQPTDGEIALNAYIFGYAGHSLVTPHAALKQLWWTDKRIDAKVTKQFVISKLRGEEREFLKRPVSFGDLTDDTYLEWISAKAKRLFLILAEIGASDQIFGCVDDSWTDEDLPIAWEDIPKLELSYNNDEALNRRFYKTQFAFLLRILPAGIHIDYGPQEHVPIEYVSTLPPAASIQSWERVHFPEAEERVFVRRKFELTDKETGQDLRSSLLSDTRRAQALRHHHIAPVWASYTSDNTGYVLSNFVPEHTLQSFLQHRTPRQFMRVDSEKRSLLLCEWMHCLTDAIAYLHHSGVVHGTIRPSNILVDVNNKIAFADVGFSTFQSGKRVIKNEEHDYSAPESHIHKDTLNFAPPPPSRSSGFSFSRIRQLSFSTSSSGSSSDASSTRERLSASTARTSTSSVRTCNYSLPPLTLGRDPLLSACTTPSASDQLSNHPVIHSPTTSSLPGSFPGLPPLRNLVVSRPEASDVYSLGCIFLDIITFIIRGKINDFVKFRGSKIGKTSMDYSFHANAERVSAWIDMMSEESLQFTDAITRGVPDMLRLVRRMLMQNALLRPTACQVRDKLSDILAITCGAETLCCDRRLWHSAEDGKAGSR